MSRAGGGLTASGMLSKFIPPSKQISGINYRTIELCIPGFQQVRESVCHQVLVQKSWLKSVVFQTLLLRFCQVSSDSAAITGRNDSVRVSVFAEGSKPAGVEVSVLEFLLF